MPTYVNLYASSLTSKISYSGKYTGMHFFNHSGSPDNDTNLKRESSLRTRPLNFYLFLLLGSAFFYNACSRKLPVKPWTALIPSYVPAVIVPDSTTTLDQALNSEYMPFFDDISSSDIPAIKQLEQGNDQSLRLKAMIVFPNESTQWEPVWLIPMSGRQLQDLSRGFSRKFAEDQYYFHKQIIHKLYMQNRIIYATHLNKWALFSESSYGIEESIRSYLGETPSISINSQQIMPASLVLNAGSLDRLIDQQGAVKYRPTVTGVFKGYRAGDLQVSKSGSDSLGNLRISGTITINPEGSTSFVKATSSINAPVELDDYIPADAAGFGLFRLAPSAVKVDSLPVITNADSLLTGHKNLLSPLTGSLSPEFAFVAFPPGGISNFGEDLFIRKLKNTDAFINALSNLVSHGYIDKNGSAYVINSTWLAKLIGSPLCTYRRFTLAITGDVAVISPRLGLTTSIRNNVTQRTVMAYSDNWVDFKKNIPSSVSSLFYANSDRFFRYLKSYLSPNNYVQIVFSKFDMATLALQKGSGNSIQMDLRTYNLQKSHQPYQEKWDYPLNGGNLTGIPVLADIGGSSRDEIIFSTDNGNIYALAADGTDLVHMSTAGEEPIGSPIVYDWYANNQDAIMVAAGNKIYAWNTNGTMLPKFPFTMQENITAPITVADVNRDGIPELIVATADRKIHVLDGRGKDITGWPVTTNTIIEKKPKFEQINGQWSVWAVAGNSLFAWQPNGNLKAGFPVFAPATINNSPVFYKGNALLNAANGQLISIGPNRLFADSLNIFRYSEHDSLAHGLHMSGINVSNTALTGAPQVDSFMIHTDSTSVQRKDLILVQSASGSVFLFNTTGSLRFTDNMGQPSANDMSPFTADLQGNKHKDILSLANFGRLYAWDVLTGQRLFDLPTASMSYPIITDLDGNGQPELIAQTRNGLECWTILR